MCSGGGGRGRSRDLKMAAPMQGCVSGRVPIYQPREVATFREGHDSPPRREECNIVRARTIHEPCTRSSHAELIRLKLTPFRSLPSSSSSSLSATGSSSFLPGVKCALGGRGLRVSLRRSLRGETVLVNKTIAVQRLRHSAALFFVCCCCSVSLLLGFTKCVALLVGWQIEGTRWSSTSREPRVH